MIPFCVSTGGGSHDISMTVEFNALAVTFSGALLGTARKKNEQVI